MEREGVKADPARAALQEAHAEIGPHLELELEGLRCLADPKKRDSSGIDGMFAGYVFLYGGGEARYRAMTTNCVSRWLPVPDGQELTRDLCQVRRLVDSGAPLTPEARLEAGSRVRVRCGPLAGLEGRILKRSGEVRLLVAVNFLKQGASLLLEDHQVEPLP